MNKPENAVSSHMLGSRMHKPCNLCGNDRQVELFAKFGYPIVECAGCKLQFLAWHLTADDLARFYSDGYFTGDTERKGYLDYAGDGDNLRQTFRAKFERLPQGQKPGRLLDVGAAMGFFLEVAAAAGWQATGLEVSSYAARQACDRGLNVVCGSSLDVFSGQSFDLVTMWDVIEHLNDPAQTLRQIAGLLAPGGRLVVSTGDTSHPFTRMLGRHARIYAPPQHLFFFSRRTLSMMLESCGFKVEGIRQDRKVVTLDYILHIAQSLVDQPALERCVKWLRQVAPKASFNLALPDVMVITARKA
jgi:SAM-dependent methyltransferase